MLYVFLSFSVLISLCLDWSSLLVAPKYGEVWKIFVHKHADQIKRAAHSLTVRRTK